MHRDRVRLGRRQAGREGVIHQQAPDVAVGHVPDQFLDVHPAVAERAAFLVGLGDLRLERDDALQSGREVGHLPCLHLLCQLLAGARPAVRPPVRDWRPGRL